MSNKSKSGIAWTERTWSPVVGCTKVSDGCKFCYAEREVNSGWSKNPKSIFYGRDFTDVRCHEDKLGQPLHWKTPSRIFVCPRADLFHDLVPDAFLDQVFAVMALCPQHSFQCLTKRPKRMRDYMLGVQDRARAQKAMFSVDLHNPLHCLGVLRDDYQGARAWPLPNVWLGVTAENQDAANERLPLLMQTPAAVRWVSCEPLLGPVDLMQIEHPNYNMPADMLTGCDSRAPCDAGTLDWVVVGGESGPNARPMHPLWAQDLRDQCGEAETPFFFKQWGEWFPREQWEYNPRLVLPDDHHAYDNSETTIVMRDLGDLYPMHRVGTKKAGRLLDGVLYDEFPA